MLPVMTNDTLDREAAIRFLQNVPEVALTALEQHVGDAEDAERDAVIAFLRSHAGEPLDTLIDMIATGEHRT